MLASAQIVRERLLYLVLAEVTEVDLISGAVRSVELEIPRHDDVRLLVWAEVTEVDLIPSAIRSVELEIPRHDDVRLLVLAKVTEAYISVMSFAGCVNTLNVPCQIHLTRRSRRQANNGRGDATDHARRRKFLSASQARHGVVAGRCTIPQMGEEREDAESRRPGRIESRTMVGPRALDVIAFDFDGVIADTVLDIATAANEVLSEFNLPAVPVSVVRSQIGGGVEALVRGLLAGHPNLPLDVAAARFRDRYGRCFDHQTTLFPGVAEVLDQLGSAGIRMAIATNKAEALTQHLVEQLGVARHFFLIVGPEIDRAPQA